MTQNLPAEKGSASSPVVQFNRFLDKMKPQMALALPKHLTADRMARLALTAFSKSTDLQECTMQSIAGSIMTAAQMGLEPGINGQGFLIPYKKTCTFVPGWKGLVDIANRSGRCTVWTGAVFEGDAFEYALGDSPFIRHKPGAEDNPSSLTYVYAVGRVNGSDWPVIEVWPMAKVWRHRDKYNKVGAKHYSFRDAEMYARKVPLLQVLKYMPSSIELANAIAVATAAEEGRNVVIEGNFVTVSDTSSDDGAAAGTAGSAVDAARAATFPPEEFAKNLPAWESLIKAGSKTADDVIAMAGTLWPLTDAQQAQLRGIAAAPVVTLADVEAQLRGAANEQALDDAADLIGSLVSEPERKKARELYEARKSTFTD